MGILIVLLVVAILAYFNWDKVVATKDRVDEKKEQAEEQLQNAK